MTTDPAEQLQHLYETELRPVFEELEAERQALLQRLLISGLIALAATGLLVLLVLRWGFEISFFVIVAGITIWWIVNGGRVQRYRANFKNHVVGRLVRFFNATMRYEPNSGISQAEFSASEIFRQRIDRYSHEDLITGTIGATAFRFSEVHAEYKTESTDSKGRRRTTWHTIFKGIFYIADFNKHFNGRTIVQPDVAQSLLGGLGQMLQGVGRKLSFSGDELVKLEDPEFEKLFVVYSTDQIEARYILSTSLMQRLTQFRKTMGVDVSLSFVNSKINLAIATRKNLFEPPHLWQSTRLQLSDLQEYLQDIKLAEDVVNELNLNLRIWTKA
ncbi:MAG TPA: DUF3137 domain-containing protein [Roseiflexaceae bacterium]|nr:DUF3137 domain-containing protein [Roseiflexaceae bacterium]HMP39721.1 DUF3137 domain-containing protein [Roseiflexaceae bacterium]